MKTLLFYHVKILALIMVVVTAVSCGGGNTQTKEYSGNVTLKAQGDKLKFLNEYENELPFTVENGLAIVKLRDNRILVVATGSKEEIISADRGMVHAVVMPDITINTGSGEVKGIIYCYTPNKDDRGINPTVYHYVYDMGGNEIYNTKSTYVAKSLLFEDGKIFHRNSAGQRTQEVVFEGAGYSTKGIDTRGQGNIYVNQ